MKVNQSIDRVVNKSGSAKRFDLGGDGLHGMRGHHSRSALDRMSRVFSRCRITCIEGRAQFVQVSRQC